MKKILCVLLFGSLLLTQPADSQVPSSGFTIDLSELMYRNPPVVRKIAVSNGVFLEYAEQGAASGTPVIFLHGFTDSWHSFEELFKHLPSNIRAYAISLRGHGDSDRPIKGYRPEDFAADVVDFIEKLKTGPVIVVGHSMGSTVAQCLAAKYPQYVKAVVLAGAFATYEDKAGLMEFKDVIDQLSDPIDASFIEEFQKSTIVKPVAQETFKLLVSESMKVPAHVWKGVAEGWEGEDYLKGLEKFSKPVLICWGDKDSYCPWKDQELLLNATNSRVIIYNGTGHALHWEEPARFATDLVKFINTVL